MKKKIVLFLCLFIGYTYAELSERQFVVFITSYNNIKWVKKNLDSVLMQDYENFRVIYVDDASSDGTGEFVEQYIKDHNLQNKFTLIKNTKRKRKMANLYNALYLCKDHEIVVMLDGDDWFACDWAFKKINRAYDNSKVWLTYGQYRNEPASEARRFGFSPKGYCSPVPGHVKKRRSYRRHAFVYMHPRSFYAWLFKCVKLEDLISETVRGWNGKFYPVSNDLAMYYPMIEMAHEHVHFISDVMYVRNVYSDLVWFKVDKYLQSKVAQEIRRKPWYRVLKKKAIDRLKNIRNEKADVFIICADELSRVPYVLNSIYNNIEHLGTVSIFYQRTNENCNEVQKIKNTFSSIRFVPYHWSGNLSLQRRLMASLRGGPNKYVVMTTDAMYVKNTIDIAEVIYWLERTYAYGFYLMHDKTTKRTPPHVYLTDEIGAWKFKFGGGKWKQVNCLDMVLYRKSHVRRLLNHLQFRTPGQLKYEMHHARINRRKVGLFYKTAKAERRTHYET